MMWVERLSSELIAQGVPRRDRVRIVLELEDHIACEPGCEERLGDPRELAVSFSEELASSRMRQAALRTFAALALTALALMVSQLAINRTGYPGFDHGLSLALFIPAALGMLVAPQVALVAGSLAALRAIRRRREPRLPAAEIRLIERRARVALFAGLATAAGLELYVVNFAFVLPPWYLALVAGVAALAGGALVAAIIGVARAAAIESSSPGLSGDVFDDLPVPGSRWLRAHPWRLGLLGSVAVAVMMILAMAHAERSLAEGLQRGIAEGLVAGAGYVVLGRAVGLFGSASGPVAPGSPDG
jgi:uncharacterized membrane protein YidH (DUF202 family)